MLMETFNASHVKAHLSSVLDVAEHQAVRIKRRGHLPTVILSEIEYKELKKKSDAVDSSRKIEAFTRLKDWVKMPVKHKDYLMDERAAAIISKHGKHWET